MTICGTGHRPNKLGGYGKPAFEKLVSIAKRFLETTRPDRVISGMALGWDQALAVAAIRCRPRIPVAAYIPFEGQESMWPEESQAYYRKILSFCETIYVVCEGGYSPSSMQKRNEAMVNDSDLVVAMWDGTSGGTGNCIRYSTKKGKEIVNLYQQYAKQ